MDCATKFPGFVFLYMMNTTVNFCVFFPFKGKVIKAAAFAAYKEN